MPDTKRRAREGARLSASSSASDYHCPHHNTLSDAVAWLHIFVRDGQHDPDLLHLLPAALAYLRRMQNLAAPS